MVAGTKMGCCITCYGGRVPLRTIVITDLLTRCKKIKDIFGRLQQAQPDSGGLSLSCLARKKNSPSQS